jgi:hypothetical protein
VRSLSSGLSTLVAVVANESNQTASSALRSSLKMYVFLATAIVANAEQAEKNAAMLKVKKRKGGRSKASAESWDRHAETLATVLAETLAEPKVFSLWRMAQPDSGFKDALFKCACTMLENPVNVKNVATQSSVLQMLQLLVTKCGGLSERLVQPISVLS